MSQNINFFYIFKFNKFLAHQFVILVGGKGHIITKYLNNISLFDIKKYDH